MKLWLLVVLVMAALTGADRLDRDQKCARELHLRLGAVLEVVDEKPGLQRRAVIDAANATYQRCRPEEKRG